MTEQREQHLTHQHALVVSQGLLVCVGQVWIAADLKIRTPVQGHILMHHPHYVGMLDLTPLRWDLSWYVPKSWLSEMRWVYQLGLSLGLWALVCRSWYAEWVNGWVSEWFKWGFKGRVKQRTPAWLVHKDKWASLYGLTRQLDGRALVTFPLTQDWHSSKRVQSSTIANMHLCAHKCTYAVHTHTYNKRIGPQNLQSLRHSQPYKTFKTPFLSDM